MLILLFRARPLFFRRDVLSESIWPGCPPASSARVYARPSQKGRVVALQRVRGGAATAPECSDAWVGSDQQKSSRGRESLREGEDRGLSTSPPAAALVLELHHEARSRARRRRVPSAIDGLRRRCLPLMCGCLSWEPLSSWSAGIVALLWSVTAVFSQARPSKRHSQPGERRSELNVFARLGCPTIGSERNSTCSPQGSISTSRCPHIGWWRYVRMHDAWYISPQWLDSLCAFTLERKRGGEREREPAPRSWIASVIFIINHAAGDFNVSGDTGAVSICSTPLAGEEGAHLSRS